MAHFKLKIGGKTMSLLDGDYDVGRMSDCWLTLDDEMVSRYHARFHVAGGVAELEDLGSRNGTFVNGERLEARRVLQDGDRIRIGRELICVLVSEQLFEDEDSELRKTLAPGEDTRFPALIGQLVLKSIKVGKLKEAERYVMALASQFQGTKVTFEHPASQACVACFLKMAESSSSGVWIDRLFQLMAGQQWLMDRATLDGVKGALDRIPRIPGTGVREYERSLVEMQREGIPVPPGLRRSIAEIADTYSDP